MQLLLLVGISTKSFAQIYIGQNAIVSIQKGTILHISENNTHPHLTAKIYAEENSTIINLANDSFPEIVYLKNDKQPKKNKGTIAKNKLKKNSQPPIVKQGTQSENREGAFSFSGTTKPSTSLFHSGKSTKAALVQNISMGTKFFPFKNSYKSDFNSFLLNNDNQIKISANEFLLSQQANLEEYTTRPPPSQMS